MLNTRNAALLRVWTLLSFFRVPSVDGANLLVVFVLFYMFFVFQRHKGSRLYFPQKPLKEFPLHLIWSLLCVYFKIGI